MLLFTLDSIDHPLRESVGVHYGWYAAHSLFLVDKGLAEVLNLLLGIVISKDVDNSHVVYFGAVFRQQTALILFEELDHVLIHNG